MAIFKKKQTRVYIPNKRNATTRLNSLYGDDANIRYLEDRINNMRNVDAYTKAESDSRFARLANQNTFTENQTIKGSTAFIEFKDSSNARKGYIGKSSASSADVELKAETNSLTLGANHHVIIKPGNNYQARYEKTPTEGVEIANKAYVDTKTGANKTILDQHENRISGNWRVIEENRNNINTLTGKVNTNTNNINNLTPKVTSNTNNINTLTGKVTTNTDNINNLTPKVTTNTNNINTLTGKVNTNTSDIEKLKQIQIPQNIAFTNQENTFTKKQTMNNGLVVSDEPVNDNDVANKKYVDDVKKLIPNNKTYKLYNLTFYKTHIANGAYMYRIVDSSLVGFFFNGMIPNQKYEVLYRIRRIDGERINLFIKAIEVVSEANGRLFAPYYKFQPHEVVFMWDVDLKPGGSGETGVKSCEVGVICIPIK